MESEGKLRAGIVGLGFAGNLHKESLKHNETISSIAVVEINSDKRLKAAAENLQTFVNVQDLLETRPDILILSVPPILNRELVTAITSSAYRPKALLIEKPLATTLSDAEEIERALNGSDILSMVGFNRSWFPSRV